MAYSFPLTPLYGPQAKHPRYGAYATQREGRPRVKSGQMLSATESSSSALSSLSLSPDLTSNPVFFGLFVFQNLLKCEVRMLKCPQSYLKSEMRSFL